MSSHFKMFIESAINSSRDCSGLLIVANSTMAISRLSSYLNSQDQSSKLAFSVWLITCNPAANALPLEPANVLFYKTINTSFVSQRTTNSSLINFIKKANCINAVFYDFAQDFRLFYIAKLIIDLGMCIKVEPVAPFPKYKISILQRVVSFFVNPRLLFKYCYLKIFSYPVSLYSYGNYKRSLLTTRPHIRLSEPHIIFDEYLPDNSKKYVQLLPPSIHYLYIENCESSLSEQSRAVFRSILNVIATSLAEHGEMLYIKPRLNRSIFKQVYPSNFTLFGSDTPCEDINMSHCTLITIASIGALTSEATKIISIVDLLINCIECRRDSSMLYSQFDYARSFTKSNLIFPNTYSRLIADLF